MQLISQQAVLEQQKAFIKNIFSDETVQDARLEKGLTIYRRNLKATASQALGITYPTVTKQIGDEMMAKIAVIMLTRQPPHAGDWGEWGIGLANLLKTLPELEDYPFVAESARLDLAIHQVERARNSTFDETSVYLLTQHDIDDLYIDLNDTVQFFSSHFPVAELRAVETEDDDISHDRLRSKIQLQQLKQNVLVYRPQLKAHVRELSKVEFDWLTLLAKEISIGESLRLIEDDRFDFSHWLPMAIEQNLIHRLTTK